MMKLPILILLSLSFVRTMAQPSDSIGRRIVLTGHLPSLIKETVIIKNEDHFFCKVHADKVGRFKAEIMSAAGYFNVNGITIYLEPGMELLIDSTVGGGYFFEGKGSIENNIL
jgi:hypothetical protein